MTTTVPTEPSQCLITMLDCDDDYRKNWRTACKLGAQLHFVVIADDNTRKQYVKYRYLPDVHQATIYSTCVWPQMSDFADARENTILILGLLNNTPKLPNVHMNMKQTYCKHVMTKRRDFFFSKP